MVFRRFFLGIFYLLGKVVDHPTREGIVGITQLKFTDELLAERQNRIRLFGYDRRI